MGNIKLSDTLKLVRRPRSNVWQANVKHPDGQWRRTSTGEKDEKKASERAFEIQAEVLFKDKHNIPTVARPAFGKVATKFKEKLQKRIESGTATESQGAWPGIVDNWLLPFFKDKLIDSINESVLEEFDEFRRQKFGGELAKGTISKHKDVLNAIFRYAVDQKLCTVNDIPKLTIKDKGRPKERRGHFTAEEFNALMAFLHNWSKESDRFSTKFLRQSLTVYVEFLCLSGLRTGEEVLALRWKDFERHERPGKPVCYRVYIRAGKKGRDGKEAIHRTYVSELAYDSLTSLQLYQMVSPEQVRESFENEDYFKDRFVFCMPDGTRIKNDRFPAMFKSALDALGMREGPDGSTRTLYSLRHTYATWKLERDQMSFEQLATVMNTSVAMIEQHYSHVTSDDFIDDIIV